MAVRDYHSKQYINNIYFDYLELVKIFIDFTDEYFILFIDIKVDIQLRMCFDKISRNTSNGD